MLQDWNSLKSKTSHGKFNQNLANRCKENERITWKHEVKWSFNEEISYWDRVE